jgi:hypothetical protein
MNNTPGLIPGLLGYKTKRNFITNITNRRLTRKRFNNMYKHLTSKKRYFSPKSIFVLKGHGSDKKSGEYRLKQDEYLLMAAECAMSTSISPKEVGIMHRTLENPDVLKHSIQIPEINTNLTQYPLQNIYGFPDDYKFEMFRPKLHNSNNPVYYKIPAISYSPLSFYDESDLDDIQFEEAIYKKVKYNNLRLFELRQSGIIQPNRPFRWNQQFVKLSDKISTQIEIAFNSNNEIKPLKVDLDRRSATYSFAGLRNNPPGILCLVPDPTLDLTFEEVESGTDELSQLFVKQLKEAFANSILTIEDIFEITERGGKPKTIANLMYFAMGWDTIFEYVRRKVPEGPVLVIHPACRSLNTENTNRDNVRFPKSFAGDDWAEMTGPERRKLIKKARLVNPRNDSGYTSE